MKLLYRINPVNIFLKKNKDGFKIMLDGLRRLLPAWKPSNMSWRISLLYYLIFFREHSLICVGGATRTGQGEVRRQMYSFFSPPCDLWGSNFGCQVRGPEPHFSEPPSGPLSVFNFIYCVCICVGTWHVAELQGKSWGCLSGLARVPQFMQSSCRPFLRQNFLCSLGSVLELSS